MYKKITGLKYDWTALQTTNYTKQNLGDLETVRLCTVFRKTLTLFCSMYLSPTSCT
jgi:hypothetical protein